MKELAEQYKQSTEIFLNLASSLKFDDLDCADSEGWTPRQVIHHVADSEAQSYARLRRLIAEPGTTIQGYDEGKWAENPTIGYRNHEIDSSIAVFKAVRQSSYELLLRMEDSLLDQKGIHTESGEYSLRDWMNSYINHPIDHANQIKKVLSL
ncbi:MAG: DinB family protein [Candidatus Nanopelagicaceae bacterium]